MNLRGKGKKEKCTNTEKSERKSQRKTEKVNNTKVKITILKSGIRLNSFFKTLIHKIKV